MYEIITNHLIILTLFRYTNRNCCLILNMVTSILICVTDNYSFLFYSRKIYGCKKGGYCEIL